MRTIHAPGLPDEVPCDFGMHLSERLGLSGADAQRLLGTWLERYEPDRRRQIQFGRQNLRRPTEDVERWLNLAGRGRCRDA